MYIILHTFLNCKRIAIGFLNSQDENLFMIRYNLLGKATKREALKIFDNHFSNNELKWLQKIDKEKWMIDLDLLLSEFPEETKETYCWLKNKIVLSPEVENYFSSKRETTWVTFYIERDEIEENAVAQDVFKISLNTQNNTLSFYNSKIKLTKGETRFMSLLLKNVNKTVSYEELADLKKTYNKSYQVNNSASHYKSKIKNKLKELSLPNSEFFNNSFDIIPEIGFVFKHNKNEINIIES